MLWQRKRHRPSRRPASTGRLGFKMLESRLLLSADRETLTVLYVQNGHPAGCGCPGCSGGSPPALESGLEAGPATSPAPAAASAATLPLSSIPVLKSLPGAKATLYLDFDGHFEAQWGAYSNLSTPAFDTDGDANTFSDSELSAIQQIWRYVAEDYAPFNVNVTTVNPGDFSNGKALRVSIGGNGSWTGGTYGGIGYVGAFTNSIANTVFVFSKNLGNGYAKYVGDAASHESGHGFGLRHQSQYSGTTKVSEYYSGPGDGRAPLMGNSYSATRSLWWNGTSSTSSSTFQDDMAVIAGSSNGFGYRADEAGNSATATAPLTVSGTQASAAGVITTTSDTDWFAFATGAGQVTFTLSVPSSLNNLDARLELRNAAGTVLTSADPGTGFGATITSTVAAGSYYLVVASHGSYGDVGQYTISGSVVAASPPAAPSNLTATAVSSSQINLSWKDNATNETGYQVERSLSGTSWSVIATLAANTTSLSSTGLSASTTYYYRVRAVSAAGSSAASNSASATTAAASGAPAAPSGLTAAAVAPTQVNLSWQDNSNNETHFVIQRSENGGQSWSTMGRVWPNVRTFSDTKASAGKTYRYRVYAENSAGNSAYTSVVVVTTPTASQPQAGPASALPADNATLIEQILGRLGSRRR